MKVNLYDSKGEEKGKITLPTIFSQKINILLLHEVVSAYLANQRKGCASTKTRGEVSGGGRKPWRQKGTGRARAGSIRSPLWCHGGVVFGPKPRDYHINLPKKKLRKALAQALAAKADLVKVIENLEFKEAKTKDMVKILKKAGLANGKVLLIVEKIDKNLWRISKNIPYLHLVERRNLNTYDVLDCKNLFFTVEALKKYDPSTSSRFTLKVPFGLKPQG